MADKSQEVRETASARCAREFERLAQSISDGAALQSLRDRFLGPQVRGASRGC